MKLRPTLRILQLHILVKFVLKVWTVSENIHAVLGDKFKFKTGE